MDLARLFLVWMAFLFMKTVPALGQESDAQLLFKVLSSGGDSLSITEICCSEKSHWAEAYRVESIRTSYGQKPLWLKIEAVEGGGLLQFKPILDEVTLYTRADANSQWQISHTGDMIAKEQKVFDSPFMALPLPASFDRENVYAEIVMTSAVSISIQQWDLPGFVSMQNADRTLKTFLLGFVIAIVLYNITVSALVRDPVFLVNALCISSLIVVALYLSGYGAAYFWADFPTASNAIFSAAVSGAVIFGGLFMFIFLKGSRETARIRLLLLIAPAIACLAAFIFIVFPLPRWLWMLSALICGALLCLLTIVVLAAAFIRGDKRAKLLAVPFLIAVVPGVSLIALNKIVGFNPFNLGNNTMEITLALEAMLFSLALASRVRVTENAIRESTQALLAERDRSSAQALAAQDNERKRLSKELHDGVGQEMLLVVSSLKRLLKKTDDPETSTSISNLVQSTSGIMGSLRRISRVMHPASIEHLGFAGTIEDTINHLNDAGHIKFTHELDIGDVKISQDTQFQLIRILQECFANVVKHSGATKCETKVHLIDNELQMKIEDDGIGIDEEDNGNQSHFGLGLTSIGERVRSMDGCWRMNESQWGGLATIIHIPQTSLWVKGNETQ